MKKDMSKALIIVLAGYILFFLSACNFAPYQGQAQIVLDLGWLFPSGDGSADGARSGSVSGTGVPDNIKGQVTSIEITVSGAGINTETRIYTKWPDRLSVTVEPGKERTVGVRINIDPASPSAVLAFGGQGTVRYIQAGQQAKVLIPIAPVETKIVVPDGLNNGRIVQINDISGDGWTLSSAQLQFYGVDVDFDAKGRIYLADQQRGVIRIDDLTSTSIDDIERGITANALAMDRRTNYLYYAISTNFIRIFNCDDPGSAVGSYDLSSENLGGANVSGIAVDEVGCVYITDLATSTVYKYDPRLPVRNRITASYSDQNLLVSPHDVIVKGNYVYVLNYAGANNSIIKLTKNLGFAGAYGVRTSTFPDINPGHFYGPLRFLAVDNEDFTIVDDWSTRVDPNADSDKLIQVNPGFQDSSWRTFGSRGNGIGQFDFWFDF
jgi:hypothetical protein